MKTSNRAVLLVSALTIATGSLSGLAAETVGECQERVIESCAEAMEDARFYERVAVGLLCTGLLVGCSANILK